MDTEDDALLQSELHWRARPGDRRRPAGSNAILAIGLVLTLVLWAVTGLALARLVAGRPTGSGVIDPMSLVALLIFGGEMFVAAIVSGRIWVAIGPTPRKVLRPFGILGPWPMLIMLFFAAVYVVAIVVAPFMPRTPAPPTSGRNWRLMDTGRRGVTYDEAVALCEKTGERVPSQDDLAAFDPPFAGGTSAWIERPADEVDLLSLTPDGRIARETPRGQRSRGNVICFRP